MGMWGFGLSRRAAVLSLVAICASAYPATGGGCIVIPLGIGTSFIRGTVRSASGILVEGLRIAAEVGVNGQVCRSEIGHTDAHGAYVIGVPKLVYRVTVLPYQIPGPNQILPRTYYPGVVRQSEAELVKITADRDGLDIVIPPALNSRVFKAIVITPDGRPAKDAKVLVEADGTHLESPLFTGPMGDVMFDGVEGIPYRFRVDSAGTFSEPMVVEAGSEPAEVNLVLPRPQLRWRAL